MSDKKLLPCPFCGGEAFIYYSGSRSQFGEVICKECESHSDRKRVDEAVESWNTRVPMQKIVKELELKQEESYKLYAIAFDPEDRCGYDAYSDAIEIVKEEGGLND